MERRQAMAVAAAGAMMGAAVVAATTSGMLHGVGGAMPSALSFGGTVAEVAAPESTTTTSLEPVVVTETRDVYDTYVVDDGGSGDRPATAAPDPAGAPTTGPTSPARPVAKAPSTGGGSGSTTTTAPSVAPPATQPSATTTTTRPPGVPDDWPADRPIPPMPEGCQKPQLEDDGHWNCDH